MPIGLKLGLKTNHWPANVLGGLDFSGPNDLCMDWKNNRYVKGLLPIVNPVVDTHSIEIKALNAGGAYDNFLANTIVRNNLGGQVVPTAENGITNSGMAGADIGVWPTNWTGYNANGLLVAVVGVGTSFGLNYIDVKFSGTNTSGSMQYPEIRMDTGSLLSGISQGDKFSQTVFVELIAGSAWGAGTLFYVAEYASATFKAVRQITFTPGARVRLFNTDNTIINAATDNLRLPLIYVAVQDTESPSFTLRIWTPQVETGAFATPPIFTTGAALTVPGNQAVISGLSMPTGVEGCIILDVQDPGASNKRLLQLDDGAVGANAIVLKYSTGNIVLERQVAGVWEGSIVVAPWMTGKIAIAYAVSTNYIKVQLIGQAVISNTAVIGYPAVTTVNYLGIGINTNNNLLGRFFEHYQHTSFTPDATSFAETSILATTRLAALS